MLEKFRVNRDKGFTLVELALVLVIVGLLITGVLKGEALIENARMKRLVNEKDAIAAAYFTFFDRFNQYPGDETIANIPTATDSTTIGNNNGQIAGGEIWNLFQDLQGANILTGNFTGLANSCPSNVYGGLITIQWNAGMSSNVIQLTSVPGQVVAAQIDLKYDDGTYNTGTIRANQAYTNPTVTLYWRL